MKYYTLITQDETTTLYSNHPKIAKDGSIIFTRDNDSDFLVCYSGHYWKQCYCSNSDGVRLGKELKPNV